MNGRGTMRLAVRGDLAFFHHLEQGGLRLRRARLISSATSTLVNTGLRKLKSP